MIDMIRNIPARSFLVLTVLSAMLLLFGTDVLANDIGYITLDRANLRSGPSLDADILETVDEGVSITVEALEDGWYKVVYNGASGYMNAEFVEKRETSQGNEQADSGQGNEYITLDRINLRAGASTDTDILVTVEAGEKIRIEATDTEWYKVVYNGMTGYMKAEYVGTPEDLKQPDPTAHGAPSGEYVTLTRVNLRSGPSTESDISATVNPGTSVTIVSQDYDWYEIICNDLHGYIKDEFIGSPEDLKQTQRAELVEWSEAKNMFTVGVPAEVYDVRTGLVYYVKSFSNGLHADVEPVTPDDTYTLKRTFNGVWSWDTRPVLVTINGRTMAASINGMPHGGGINQSNDMNGQICIHFKGSRTHNGNAYHEADHQNSVMEAYNKSNW